MTAAAGSFDLGIADTPEGPVPIVRRGPPDGPVVLLLQPLFEEMNRCRRFLADLGRELAALGIVTLLPDLPGEGDSGVALGERGAEHWDGAASALASGCIAAIGMRAGCLIGGTGTLPRFHIAPVRDGHALFRDMMRAQAFADLEATGRRVEPAAYVQQLQRGETVRLAGYAISPSLYVSLVERTPPPADTIDFDAAPIWRQAEPVRALAEARRIAALIAAVPTR